MISYGDRVRVAAAAGASLMLALALVFSYWQSDHEKQVMDGLFMEYDADGLKICFGLWEEETEGKYCLFLPACFGEKQGAFTLRYNDRKGVLKIDGIPYREGEVWAGARQEGIYTIQLQSPWGALYMEKTLQVLVSEGVPAIMIEAEAAEDIQSQEEFRKKKYIETGTMVMLDQAGKIVCKEKLEKFKVRGNLTATLEKKPFTFTLESPAGLCGMKPGRKWNLLANATDGSYIRNKIVLDLANKSIDAYEPDGEFAEVYLNGIYQGLYLLTEPVEVGGNRLELSLEEGWFLEMELDFRMEEDKAYVITDRGQIFAVHSDTGVSQAEKSRISYMLNDIESALFARDGVSLLSGKTLGELIDLESWASAWLVQELSGDHDTGIASQFAYVPDKESPFLYAGPVWDFDGTMGNVNTAMFRNPRALTASIENSRPEGNANQNRWLSAMYRNPEFQAVVREKYQRDFLDNLEEMLYTDIGLYAARIGRSAVLDAFRWSGERLGWMFVLPENLYIPEEGDYTRFAALGCHIDMVKDFLAQKKDFLDRLWLGREEFCIVEVRNDAPFLNQDYNQTLYYWVEPGSLVGELPFYEEEGYRFVGYKNQDTGEMEDARTPVTEDCVLEGVWEQAGEG